MNIANQIFEIIASCLKVDSYRDKLSGKMPRTHKDVEAFQKDLAGKHGFNGNPTRGNNIEHKLFKDSKDRADIWFDTFGDQHELIVEIDAARADQVAKKMISRFRYAIGSHSIDRRENKPIIYVALLYRGTDAMNVEECKKYFRMGADLLLNLNDRNIFIGYIIGDDVLKDERFVFMSSSQGIIPYDNDSVFRRESYLQFLLEENIKSVDNYMMPLNKLDKIDAKERAHFLGDLEHSLTKEEQASCIKKWFYQKDLSKDQSSYWNKFITFLQTQK